MATKATKATTKAARPSTKAKVKTPKTTGTDLIRRVTWDRVANKKNLPDYQTGDTVGVYVKVKEGEKERVQLFTGVVIKVQGSGISRHFTVRKIASGVGVERTFPANSPIIDRIEMVSRGKVRRARLFYLRGLKGRSARLNSEAYFADAGAPGAADDVAGATAAGADAPTDVTAEKAPPKAKKADKPAKAKPAKA
jgi:large subunit ribosomal protein L19